MTGGRNSKTGDSLSEAPSYYRSFKSTMTKYLAIAFLITGFLVGDAYGEEEVYYCAETASVGFNYDKKT